MKAELQGRLSKKENELSFYETKVYDNLMSIEMTAESAIALWEKDASSPELKELLDSILYKSQFLKGILK